MKESLMNKDTKTKYTLSLTFSLIGIFICLEGLGITHLGENKNNTPGEILVLTGIIFIIASIMIHMDKRKKINNFLASLLTLIMGILMGWVSLFGKASGFSGNNTVLALITDLPIDKLMFGLGSLLCFVVSAIAFSMFLKSKPSNKEIN